VQILQSPKKRINAAIQRKHVFAAHVAIDQGVMAICQYAPVLDVGCGNPYIGLWRWLKRLDFRGQYVGIDSKFPDEVKKDFRGDIYVRQCNIDGARLPFPPTERHMVKEYSTAFCVDTLAQIKNRDQLVLEMRRIAAQVVIVGGVSVDDLRGWDFQVIGLETFGGKSEAWGIWFNHWAASTRARLDITPATSTGYIGGDSGVEQKTLYHCEKCGGLDYDGNASFTCAKCGTVNRG